MTDSRSLLSPEEIAVRAGRQPPHLYLPRRAEVFAERDIRLRQNAAGHAMRDYLLLMADVARAQHDALQAAPAARLPGTAALEQASQEGRAPLPATAWPRDPQWHAILIRLVDSLLPRVAEGPARDTLAALRTAAPDALERQADKLLANINLGLDMAAAPFIAAALQVYWTQLVLATQDAHGDDRTAPFGRVQDATRCPCCASLPVASISRIDPGAGGLRYLQCSLCATQWHMVRIKCARCDSTKGIHYQAAQHVSAAADAKPAVEAETCDECGAYLKIARMERDQNVEAAADDLASVTLDLLVSEAGFRRHGVNFMLLFGEPDDASLPPAGGAA